MTTLDKGLRNKLENTITRAREVAEEAANSAIEQLGVERSSPYAYLTTEQKELRRRVRAHGRQLGDLRDPKNETQEIVRLTEEVSYEHWHRMLFARFLAENQLLMFYEGDDIENAVAVSLEECEEMAPVMGYSNGWELAARLATKMLPQIFRPESPVFELHFSPEKQKALEVLLSDLESEVFKASDSLGWVYQFWQSKKKESVNKSEVKIGARELPSVTQLFTEPYMVKYLLDNSLGAWWAHKRLSKEELKNATTEEELRVRACIPGLPFEYLRFVKDDEGTWTPAGGTFEGWPDSLSKLKALDPCCGSGHFLVAAFQMLVPMRIELEGLSAKEACNAVLNENIHGLEIDQRCVELAAFAVALTAWKYPGAGGFRQLPDLQIAWCGQSVNVKEEEWLALAEDDSVLKFHLEELYNLFKDAPVLGSLLNPRNTFEAGGLFKKDWESVSNILQTKLEKKKNENDGLGIVAKGIEKAFQLLGDKYHWVITNVPYLSRSKQCEKLRDFNESYYSKAKSDLATVFLQRCIEISFESSILNLVLPQNWMFLSSYKKLRELILKKYKFNYIVRIGEGGFSSKAAAGAFTVLLSISCTQLPENSKYEYGNIDLSIFSSPDSKEKAIKEINVQKVSQFKQLKNPDMRILFEMTNTEGTLLGNYAECFQGLRTGDRERFIKNIWEIQEITSQWEYFRNSNSEVTDSTFPAANID